MIKERKKEINLRDKVAVVTGGTSGIGLKIAETFAQAGSKIAICSRNKANVDRAVRFFQNKKTAVYGKTVDVSQKESIFELADDVEKMFGGIDIWVSNAGTYPQKKLIETTEEEWQMVMDVNMKSVYYGGLNTHRVAIANSRIKALKDGMVTFSAKNRKKNCTEPITISAVEFIRRFLLHSLPKRFVKIRHYGFLANRNRAKNLKAIRLLMGLDTPATNKRIGVKSSFLTYIVR